jgi:hypothetical protein
MTAKAGMDPGAQLPRAARFDRFQLRWRVALSRGHLSARAPLRGRRPCGRSGRDRSRARHRPSRDPIAAGRSRGYHTLSSILFSRGDMASALAADERATTMNKYDLAALGDYGARLVCARQIERGMAMLGAVETGVLRQPAISSTCSSGTTCRATCRRRRRTPTRSLATPSPWACSRAPWRRPPMWTATRRATRSPGWWRCGPHGATMQGARCANSSPSPRFWSGLRMIWLRWDCQARDSYGEACPARDAESMADRALAFLRCRIFGRKTGIHPRLRGTGIFLKML